MCRFYFGVIIDHPAQFDSREISRQWKPSAINDKGIIISSKV